MRILVAGGGLFGKEHLKTLTAIGGITLAVAETHAAELTRLGAMFELTDYDADAFSLLRRFRPDGVVVATPASAHAPLAVAVLGLGLPVLVEKPVAPDSATMTHLCDVAGASSSFLQPGHILRFSSDHQRLLQVLRQGEIGELLQISSRRYRDSSHVVRYADIDPVLMTMIHDIDLAQWFDGGSATSVAATRRPERTSRSLTSARLASSSGAIWNLSTAWLHPGTDCPADRVEIIGTHGSAELVVGSNIVVYGNTCRQIELDAEDDPLRKELECFLAGIRAGALKAPVTPQDALQGLLTVEMILRALVTR